MCVYLSISIDTYLSTNLHAYLFQISRNIYIESLYYIYAILFCFAASCISSRVWRYGINSGFPCCRSRTRSVSLRRSRFKRCHAVKGGSCLAKPRLYWRLCNYTTFSTSSNPTASNLQFEKLLKPINGVYLNHFLGRHCLLQMRQKTKRRPGHRLGRVDAKTKPKTSLSNPYNLKMFPLRIPCRPHASLSPAGLGGQEASCHGCFPSSHLHSQA